MKNKAIQQQTNQLTDFKNDKNKIRTINIETNGQPKEISINNTKAPRQVFLFTASSIRDEY